MEITREDIKRWWDQGSAQSTETTHMIVVSDTFDYDYYPVYVTAKQQSEVFDQITQINGTKFLAVKEVYAYFLPFSFQVMESRAYFPETDPLVDSSSTLNTTRSSS